ncbi:MAG: type I DNA topoisomerase [Marinifilaceae bacterium]|nr:type I DNA topoisomerase [Marinifilaceae bacterium]
MSNNRVDNLVIVESPAKAKTIEKFLGAGYTVKSSFGHIRDLSKKDLGVNIEDNFTPIYEISPEKKSVVKELKDLAKVADNVLLASDEDREGEAIAWHLAEVLKLNPETTKRIVFHEITKDAILHAIENPRHIDKNLVYAQQARRVLDRLVGFELSPVLWRKVKPSLSAGRVQSVAVRLIVEREREINNHQSQSMFGVSAIFIGSNGQSFKADLTEKFEDEQSAKDFVTKCIGAEFVVTAVDTKPTVRRPAPPFTTSTLQQEASRKLGFSVSQTMSVAQHLYEQGLITYMRTDSVNLSDLALNSAKSVICNKLGSNYSKRRQYATNTKGAQEAHEAIRPTYIDRETIDGDKNEQQLYELIYKRTLASQMADAELERTTAEIDIIHDGGVKDEKKFCAIGEIIIFDGFLKVYMESNDDESDTLQTAILPTLTVGELLDRKEIVAKEQYSQHPPRYTEASLVKKMETLGIGRPSTYAPTITTIINRGYVVKDSREGVPTPIKTIKLSGEKKISVTTSKKNLGAEKKKLFPSDIGIVVTDFLNEHFSDIMDYNFTANAEQSLDDIAEGKIEWEKMMGEFYTPFHKQVEETIENSERNSGERILGEEPGTGNKVSVRIGRFGPVAQIGEGENVRYAGLQKGQLMDNITLEEALALFKFPRHLGEFEESEVTIGVGRFGPYIRHNGEFVSLKKGEDDPGTITLEQAIERIEEKRSADKNKIIADFGDGMQLLNGRFGAYLCCNKVNYKLPKGTDATLLTKEDCMAIMADEKNKSNGKSSKKTTTKRKTTK